MLHSVCTPQGCELNYTLLMHYSVLAMNKEIMWIIAAILIIIFLKYKIYR